MFLKRYAEKPILSFMNKTHISNIPSKNVGEINPRWLSVTKACHYASMSDKTLMRHVLSGEIHGKKVGGKWYIDRFSIDDFFHGDDPFIDETVARILEKVT